MPLIEWKKEFSVGVAEVDHEHQQLVALINALYDALPQDDAENKVMDFLGEIYTQIAAHFALEEKIMRSRNYDRYADHKSDHERLLDELRDIMDDYEENAYFDDGEFSGHLEGWFTGHFKTHDARLHKYLGE